MLKKHLSISDFRRNINSNSSTGDSENLRSTYLKLITTQTLSEKDKTIALRTIAYLMCAGDNNMHKLAYAMALWYGYCTNDYEAALDIAASLRYYPVIELIKSHMGMNEGKIDDANSILNKALSNVYKDEYYRSEQQYALSRTIETQKNVVAVAPTSYGKSDMLLKKVLHYYGAGKNTCILVPTKSLMAQTLHQLMTRKGDRKDVIVHPDTFNNAEHFIAIFTQERLANFQVQYPNATLDYIFVDEAHSLMGGDERSLALSRCLVIARTRNPTANVDFYSPFIINPEKSLELVHLESRESNATIYKVDEYMKIPRYMVWDNKSGVLEVYDQFMGTQIPLKTVLTDSAAFIIDSAKHKNIIYVNSPSQVEQFANELASKLPLVDYSEDEQKIMDELCQTLSATVHESYNLIRLLRHGIIISHGKMFDNVKDYIENLHRQLKGVRFVITTSTLLEGVNLPADTLFMLNYYKGPNNLSYSSFHNLVGRIARHNRLFNFNEPDLSLLTPSIYFIKGDYLNSRSCDPIRFLNANAKEGLATNDVIKNPLLTAYKNNSDGKREQQAILIANSDQANSVYYNNTFNGDLPLAGTDVGRLMYENNVAFSDIMNKEEMIAGYCEDWRNNQTVIDDGQSIINAIYRIFLLPMFRGSERSKSWVYSLYASSNKRNVYANIIDSRINGEKPGSIIGKSVAAWRKKIDEPVYVGSIGDVDKWGSNTGSRYLDYHIFSKEDGNLMPSYALALLKENFDHLDYYILPFLEIMHSLELIDDKFYLKVKYGTDDDRIVELIKLGFDISLATPIAKNQELWNAVAKYNSGDRKISREEVLSLFEEKNLSLMSLNAIENLI